MRKIPLKTWEVIALLVWMVGIFWFSSMPNLSSGLKEDFILRKLAHCFEYAVLTFLFFRVLRRRVESPWNVFFGAAIFSIGYALTDEIHQTFVFGRSGIIKDVLIDSIGVLMGLVSQISFRKPA